ncbi:lysoplasmalogenase [Vibrio sp. S17_S38]|uniref:lysoplasmalogenase n=1 Tax=Vibrio sp. S17_S38 TaxID=2720229 RepID=UPI001680582C|nr:lysoplasmalogenase [Vibrio sp. S17_S38]MBD1573981.1 lysoplasmalogenase [Vibrio sp. S17_S38]
MSYWLTMGLLTIFMCIGIKKESATALKFLKPASLVVLLLSAFLFTTTPHSLSYFALLCGLALSLFAQIKEASGNQNKRWQLICFALVSLCYSVMFWIQVDKVSWVVPVILLAFSIVLFFLLLPLFDGFVIPAAVIGIIVWQLSWAAGEVWNQHHAWSNFIGFIGSLFLALSALIWVIHHFKSSFRYSNYLFLVTYFASQTFITSSIIF